MEFREYASRETSAVITRLMAGQAEAQVRRAREALEAAARALDASVAQVGADDEARDLVQRLEAAAGIAVQRVQKEAAQAVEAVRDELAAARQAHEDAEARLAALRTDLAAETDRANSAEADLDATIEAHRQIEEELAGLRELLDAARGEATRLAADLDAENAQRAILTADLTAAAERQAHLQAELAAARASAAEDADRRATLHAELDAARGTLASLDEARRALQGNLDAETQAAEQLRGDRDAARAELETTRADRDRARGEILALRADLDAARTERDGARGDLLAARAALEIATARTPLFLQAAEACRALGAATTITDLLDRLATQTGTAFSRAAIFRVKTHHLEGEHAVGFDTDVSKLVVPAALDSLVTRARAAGHAVEAGPGDPTAAAPFGGQPHVAVALPLTFQDEPLAILYADAAEPPEGAHDERPAFAALLAEHATALLARMSQELKMLHEMRDYAAMLLQEAEQMYAADLEAGRSDTERRHRLRDTVECARQLYAQRAALEGAAAAGLLDEQIAAMAAATPPTPFARDLAELAPRAARKGASRAS